MLVDVSNKPNTYVRNYVELSKRYYESAVKEMETLRKKGVEIVGCQDLFDEEMDQVFHVILWLF